MLRIEAPLNKGSLFGTHLEVNNYKLYSSLYILYIVCVCVVCVCDGSVIQQKNLSALLHKVNFKL